MSIFGKIFRSVRVKVSEVFSAVFGAARAEKFGREALAILKSDLGKIAMAAVFGVSKIASGAVARKMAFTEIKIAALEAGLDAKDSIVNLLIELAVGRLKGSFSEE